VEGGLFAGLHAGLRRLGVAVGAKFRGASAGFRLARRMMAGFACEWVLGVFELDGAHRIA
jgi:hypothetical protein